MPRRSGKLPAYKYNSGMKFTIRDADGVVERLGNGLSVVPAALRARMWIGSCLDVGIQGGNSRRGNQNTIVRNAK